MKFISSKINLLNKNIRDEVFAFTFFIKLNLFMLLLTQTLASLWNQYFGREQGHLHLLSTTQLHLQRRGTTFQSINMMSGVDHFTSNP